MMIVNSLLAGQIMIFLREQAESANLRTKIKKTNFQLSIIITINRRVQFAQSQHLLFYNQNIFIEQMFGMGLGMDMGMMMGMQMGMGMGMGMGGMGMGGMGRQEIIINNNGYGGGTTTIIEEGGFFGPREEIIINNGGGYGGYGGYGNNVMIGNGGYGYGYCQPGCRNACCVRVCPVGCMNTCCRPPVMVTQPQVIQSYQPQVRQQPVVVQQPAQQQVRQQQAQQVKPQQTQQTQQQTQQQTNTYNQDDDYYPELDQNQNQYTSNGNNGNNINQYTNNGNNGNNNNQYTINPYSTNNNNVVNTYQNPNQPMKVPYQPIQKQVATEVNVNHSMFVLMYGKWEGPKSFQLTRVAFDKYAMGQIKKMKIRTNLQPHSNSLQHGEVIMKIVVGNHDLYYAAQPNFIQEYFNKILLVKLRWPSIPQQIQFAGEISGPIMKKSDFLGNWQQRFVRITKQDGLMSYRNQNQNYTLHIKSTRQIWTWFEIIQGKYVVIKLKGNNVKVEFGIPIAHCQVWICAFYSLLENHHGY